MRFLIEQIAIHPKDPAAAMKLLNDMGAQDWTTDEARATGLVFGADAEPQARLAFNYDLAPLPVEFEVLSYDDTSINWMDERPGVTSHRVSHLGMHCTKDELDCWRLFFAERGIGVAQEVRTYFHSNPAIAGRRYYNYVIFDTFDILGVDIKMIVREDAVSDGDA